MHVTQVFRLFVVLPLLALVVGCGRGKSANPLNPSLAGPIAGVEISAPKPLLPAAGTSFRPDGGPVTLTIENASTNGQRPLTYTFEVATDSAMSGVVFAREGVAPGPDGRTSVQIAGPLTPGRTHYWRARAADGANEGPHSAMVTFLVSEPVTFGAPSLLAPINGATAASATPLLRTSNAARTGPAEPTRYQFEVSLNDAFAGLVSNVTVDEQDGETVVAVGPLTPSTLHYWRVRARSESAQSPWSATQAFRTPAGATVPGPPSGLPPSNPGARPDPREGLAMVAAVIDDLRRRGISIDGDCGAFEITRHVAWAFANRGAGLERKPGGRNCQGRSIDIVLFTDGMSVDMLIGAGVDNGPVWQEHGVLSDWRDWWIAPTNPN